MSVEVSETKIFKGLTYFFPKSAGLESLDSVPIVGIVQILQDKFPLNTNVMLVRNDSGSFSVKREDFLDALEKTKLVEEDSLPVAE